MLPITNAALILLALPNMCVSCRAMLMRLFNDEEEVIDSTNKNRARPRAGANAESEPADSEILIDAEEVEEGGDDEAVVVAVAEEEAAPKEEGEGL